MTGADEGAEPSRIVGAAHHRYDDAPAWPIYVEGILHTRGDRALTSMTRLIPAVALVAVLAVSPGCISTIAEAPSPEATEATGPFPADYELIVRKWILSDLFRIVSIDDLDVSKPEVGVSRRLIFGDEQGWRAQVSFWGRDRIGSSTGRMDYTVLIRDGEVVAQQKKP